jgi:predicted nucleic acid-binding protein
MSDRLIVGDSNLLVHLTNLESADDVAATRSVRRLEAEGAVLVYTSQNLAEFWNVCTRLAPGGLALSIDETARRASLIEAHFLFMPETEVTDKIFRELLIRYSVKGVQVHDARLTAVMLASGVREILTFDRDDFRRYSELVVLHPDSF